MLKPHNRAEVEFDLIKLLAEQGQNSRVYIAHDHQLDAQIVVKEVPKASLQSPSTFFDESKALYRSAHPNVVPIYYACQDADSIFLAMPFYAKGSLEALLHVKFLSVRQIVAIASQLLAGLHNIHSKGLVHFDIKPSNILLSEREEALIADFGLAKQLNLKGVAEQDRFYVRIMPPEGFSGHEHDITFDIYQVGLTLYRMCNGEAEFDAQFAVYNQNGFDRDAFRYAVRNGHFPDQKQYLPHIPNKIRRTIKKCLAADPSARFQSALDVSNALADIDGPILDWTFEVNGDTRIWEKNISGTLCRLTVESTGKSECIKSVNGKPARRVKALCVPQISLDDIQKFLRET